MNKYRDYDNYLKEYPDEKGYFGKYGGVYLDDPELIQAFKEYAEAYHTIAQCITASASRLSWVAPKYTSSGRT